MNLQRQYNSRKKEIKKRLYEFRQVWRQPDERIFAELAFCFCTPQSKAKACWHAVSSLEKSGKLYSGSLDEIRAALHRNVRFHNNKAGYILHARGVLSEFGEIQIKKKLSQLGTPFEMREWLVSNLKGLGHKEASHFLRNIGMGQDLAILDRHILKNLHKHGAIKEIPKSLTPRKYKEIEEEMRAFSSKVKIPMDEMDLLFWSEETGEVFK